MEVSTGTTRKKGFKFRLSIGNKILAGFLFLIFLFIVYGLIIFSRVNNIREVINSSKEVYRPSQTAIKEMVLLVTRSKMLVTNWVYLQANEEDRKALKQLQENEYPKLKAELTRLREFWPSDSQKAKLDTVFIKFEELLAIQQENVQANLQSFEDYEDPLKKLLAEDVIESQIIPNTSKLIERLDKLTQSQDQMTAMSDQEVIDSTDTLMSYTLILGIVIIVSGLFSALVLMRTITRPVNFLKSVILKLGRGELVEEKGTAFSSDEIGEMAVATESLVAGLKATSNFAENIGNGNYETEFSPLSEQDVLGNALITMRNNLKKVAEDDKKRNWATEGLARFGEILRTNNSDIGKLSDEIVGNLVKYLRANQGALYIIDDVDRDEEVTMSMKACYAWDKKKFINQKIHRGEGLAGQTWQEGEMVYITDIPANYIRITSGLGDANPTAILIVPLKVNDQIFGVVEIASFNEFKDFEMEFVQKIAESIASTISSVKINARTQKLLEESQEMTEQMRAQEEEMRQNMEELQATQEEMQRGQAETEGTLQAINSALLVAEFTPDGDLIKANGNYLDVLGYDQQEVMGENHRMFIPREDRNTEDYRSLWRELGMGRSNRGDFKYLHKRGETVWLRGNLSPIRSTMGEVIKVMLIATDITSSKK